MSLAGSISGMRVLHGVHVSPLTTITKSVFCGAGTWLYRPMPRAMKNSMFAFWICTRLCKP